MARTSNLLGVRLPPPRLPADPFVVACIDPPLDPEGVTFPELVLLGRIHRCWPMESPARLCWTERYAVRRGLLVEIAHPARGRSPTGAVYSEFRLTPKGLAMLERKRAEWQAQHAKTVPLANGTDS